MKRPGLLIFDCDGVLIDSEALACQAIADELGDWGLAYEGAAVARRFAGYTDAQIARAIEAESGVALPRDFPQRVQERALAAFERALANPAGVEGFLERSGSPRCVASNSGRKRLLRALEIAGLMKFFGPERAFSAEQVAASKPAPDLHLLAARTLGFEPEECLVIEDSETGVEAARRAGMAAVGFLGASHLSAEDRGLQAARLLERGAQVTFADFAGLEAWLDAL